MQSTFNVPNAELALETAFEEGRIRATNLGDDISSGVGAQTNTAVNAIFLAATQHFFTGMFNGGPVTQTTVDFQGLTQNQLQEVVLIHELYILLEQSVRITPAKRYCSVMAKWFSEGSGRRLLSSEDAFTERRPVTCAVRVG